MLKAKYTLDGQIPTLLEFIQGERFDVKEIIGPDENGQYIFKGGTRFEFIEEIIEIEDEITGLLIEERRQKQIEVEIPVENIEEILRLIPLHGPLIARMSIFRRVQNARQFGSTIISEFAMENILLGITDERQTTRVIEATKLITAALQTGSLYEAMDEIKRVPIAKIDLKFLTEDRLLSFLHKIEDYLDIKRTSSL